MTLHWKVVIDAQDPHAQADFWAAALGYEVEDHSALVDRLLGQGVVPAELTLTHHGRSAWRDAAAVRHPEDPYEKESGTGLGRRLLFQRVPETKTVKNRIHLDIHSEAGAGAEGEGGGREAETARLQELGASVLRHVAAQGGEWVLMADPEGNEFCLH